MPYIKQEERTPATRRYPGDVGELNYAITTLLMEYVKGEGLRYKAINDVLGALEGAKLEFYRRVAAPYEDRKCTENGDVYV